MGLGLDGSEHRATHPRMRGRESVRESLGRRPRKRSSHECGETAGSIERRETGRGRREPMRPSHTRRKTPSREP